MTKAQSCPDYVNVKTRETWSIVVAYEDVETRHRAMAVCDHLVKRFWRGVEFEFHWWRLDFLEDLGMATTAELDASGADFIIFCTHPEYGFSPAVRQWCGRWTAGRGAREGALVDLTNPGNHETALALSRHSFLREAARRATMDYLTQSPEGLAGALPNTAESMAMRAEQVTSVLDGILQYRPAPRFLL